MSKCHLLFGFCWNFLRNRKNTYGWLFHFSNASPKCGKNQGKTYTFIFFGLFLSYLNTEPYLHSVVMLFEYCSLRLWTRLVSRIQVAIQCFVLFLYYLPLKVGKPPYQRKMALFQMQTVLSVVTFVPIFLLNDTDHNLLKKSPPRHGLMSVASGSYACLTIFSYLLFTKFAEIIMVHRIVWDNTAHPHCFLCSAFCHIWNHKVCLCLHLLFWAASILKFCFTQHPAVH